MKCMVIPVVNWAIGIITRVLKKNLEARPVKHSIDSLQKTAVLATWHVIRKVLQSETWSMSGGDHSWLKRRSTREGEKDCERRHNNNNNNNYYCYYYCYKMLGLGSQKLSGRQGNFTVKTKCKNVIWENIFKDSKFTVFWYVTPCSLV